MITASPPTRHPQPQPHQAPQGPQDSPAPAACWQRELAAAIEDPLELCRLLQLDPGTALAGLDAAQGFRLRVPRG